MQISLNLQKLQRNKGSALLFQMETRLNLAKSKAGELDGAMSKAGELDGATGREGGLDGATSKEGRLDGATSREGGYPLVKSKA